MPPMTKSFSAVRSILELIRRESGNRSLVLIASMTILASIFETAVFIILSHAARSVEDTGGEFFTLYIFILVFLLWFTTVRQSRYILSAIMQRIVTIIRLRVVEKAKKADLLAFERIGHSEILVQFTDDTEAVAEASRELAQVAGKIMVLLCVLAYIAMLSLPAFLLVIAGLTAGALIYAMNMTRIWNTIVEFREKLKDIFVDIKHILYGFKELRLNDKKSDAFYKEGFKARAAELLDVKLRLGEYNILNYVIATVVWYIILAAVAFGLPSLEYIEPEGIMALVVAVLFLPLDVFMAAVPFINRASVSLERVQLMENSLDALIGAEPAPQDLTHIMDFSEIRAEEIVFHYQDPTDKDAFFLGPLSFSIRRGEILFLTGGNGHGKSTLLKLILGLYRPDSGRFLLDGREIDMACCRSLFSAVFSDYHLFDQLYGMKDIDPERVDAYLAKMHLEGKTRFENGKFSTLDLSSGQKKRMALICALLEDKQVIALDEWASDQDPVFRQYFYRELLPELKAAGKTIIAVTHDEAYYDAADRKIVLDYGRICQDGLSA